MINVDELVSKKKNQRTLLISSRPKIVGTESRFAVRIQVVLLPNAEGWPKIIFGTTKVFKSIA